MGFSKRGATAAALLGVIVALLTAVSALAAEEPLYESDPTLSLLGNCETIASVDPVPDPSCPYPTPPGGPTGRFDKPRPIAVDPYGNEYVFSWADGDDSKGRVDVFDDEGRFITETNVPDAKTAAVDSKGNIYVFEELGDVVRYQPSEYKPEEGKIKYGSPATLVASGAFQGSVAVDPANDQVLIARDTISRYKSAAEGNAFIKTYAPEGLVWTEAMVVDGQRRRIYVSFCAKINEQCGVKVLDADEPEEVLETISGSTVPAGAFASLSGRLPIAVDEGTGDFFIVDAPAKLIYRFSEGYEFLSQQEFKELQTGSKIAISNGTRSLSAEPCDYPADPPPLAGDACNRHYFFVTVFKSDGRAAAFHPSDQSLPVIEEVSTAAIGETEAELAARIFPGGLETSYHFEITTQASYEVNGWTGANFLDEGTISAESLATEVSTFATGLTSGVTYRFRAVADNEIGLAEEEGQNETSFTTYNDAPISVGCPNEALRFSLSALLPDCRAYELVTPADTNGRPPKGTGFLGSFFSTVQASPTGDAVSFKIEGGSLPDSSGVGSFEGDPYVARRAASGWDTELAGPTGAEVTQSAPASFSPDQNYIFWRSLGEGPLGPVGIIYNEYLRYPDGHSELIGRGSEGNEPVASGKLITEDASHVVFESINLGFNPAIKLEPDAPPTGTRAVYDRTIDPVTGAEETHTVSLLPGDVTPKAGENASYQGGSEDGEGIAFSISTNPPDSESTLYLRVNNETTYEIGKEVEFAGVSEGGSRIFYVEEGDLKAFDVASEEVIEFAATGDAVPVNVASDGSRAYFISPSVLDGTNPEGDTAIAPAAGQGTLGARGTGTLAAAAGKGTVKKGTPDVTGVTTEEGEFQAGMRISGTGIPEGTTIETVEPGVLTLSNLATQSGSTALAAGSRRVTDVSTGSGAFQVGMNITANGIPAGTVITAIDETADTLTLSKEASPTDTQPLSAFAQNLYLSEAGTISFIATVTARDAEGEVPPLLTNPFDGLGLWTAAVGSQPAKDPSRLNPDGSVFLFQSRADITGYPESEFPQIYRYDTDGGTLRCISCIPTGVAATGGAALESYTFDSFSPKPFSPFGFVPNLNPAGTRVFFDSTEALVSTDTDEVTDVYEWEAQGVGSCTRPQGCLYLISTGQSGRDNFLYGHSTSGDDVFFTTGDKLTGWDSGENATSIYDAKVGGGFPEPDKEICTGEACQGTPISPGPQLAAPTTKPVGRSGDLAPSKTCPKGKRKVKKNGKVRCVKKKQKKHKGGKAKQRAAANRGAGK